MNKNDFKIGDLVYHQSNEYQKMIVIQASEKSYFLKCRWIDPSGHVHLQEFKNIELEFYQAVIFDHDMNMLIKE